MRRAVDELLRRALDGDERGWEALWAEIRPQVFALTGRGRLTGRLSQQPASRRLVRDRVAERLAADDGARLRRYAVAAEAREGSTSFAAWLATVTTRAALDHSWADDGAAPSTPAPTDDSRREPEATKGGHPALLLTAAEMLVGARRLLGRPEFALLHLWLQGATPDELAQALELDDRSEAAGGLYRAITVLRERCVEREGGEDAEPAEGCPDVAELVGAEKRPTGHANHRASCRACAAIALITAARDRAKRRQPAPDDCPNHEPALAALVDGSVAPDELAPLAAHLERCSSCAAVWLSLGLFRHEIDHLTQPREPAAATTASAPPSKGADGRATGEETPGSERARTPSPRTWRRAGQLASIAAAAVVLGLWLGRGTSPEADGMTPTGLAATPSAAPGSSASGPPDGNVAKEGRRGVLNVHCRPRCDAVTVDTRRFGPSPVRGEAMPEGLHSVRLARGDQSRRIVVRVYDGETTSLVVEMTPPEQAPTAEDRPARGAATATGEADGAVTGYLSVSCEPSCRTVLVDGRDLGRSPVVRYPVAAGAHRLELRAGPVVRTLPIEVDAAEMQSLHLAMDAR